MYIQIYVHIYIHIYIHIYVHIYIHIYMQATCSSSLLIPPSIMLDWRKRERVHEPSASWWSSAVARSTCGVLTHLLFSHNVALPYIICMTCCIYSQSCTPTPSVSNIITRPGTIVTDTQCAQNGMSPRAQSQTISLYEYVHVIKGVLLSLAPTPEMLRMSMPLTLIKMSSTCSTTH